VKQHGHVTLELVCLILKQTCRHIGPFSCFYLDLTCVTNKRVVKLEVLGALLANLRFLPRLSWMKTLEVYIECKHCGLTIFTTNAVKTVRLATCLVYILVLFNMFGYCVEVDKPLRLRVRFKGAP